MKKISIILMFCFASVVGWAQTFPNTTNTGSNNTISNFLGAISADTMVQIKKDFVDTSNANYSRAKSYMGSVIRTGNNLWIRGSSNGNTTPNKWYDLSNQNAMKYTDTSSMLSPYHASFYNASFDTTTRIFSLIPITGNPPITFVIPRGGSVNGITSVASSRTGNILRQTGDNGFIWDSNIRDADSATQGTVTSVSSLQPLTVTNQTTNPVISFDAPIYDVRNYASLSAAVTAIGSLSATLLIPTSQVVSSSLTVPSNINLEILKGGLLSVSSGQILQISGGLSAGLFQVFTGTGTVIFDTGVIKQAVPQWWYIGSGSWHTAFNAGLTAISGKGIPLFVPGQRYRTTGTITLPNNTNMIGILNRFGGSVIEYTGTGVAINISSGYTRDRVSGINVTGGGSGNTAIAFLIARPNTIVEDCYVFDFRGESGFKVTDSASNSGGYLSVLNRCLIYANPLLVGVLGDLKYGFNLGSNANGVVLNDCETLLTGAEHGAALYVSAGSGIRVNNMTVESSYSGSFNIPAISIF